MKRILLCSVLFLGGCSFSASSPSIDHYLAMRSQQRQQRVEDERWQNLDQRVTAQQKQIESLCETVWNEAPK